MQLPNLTVRATFSVVHSCESGLAWRFRHTQDAVWSSLATVCRRQKRKKKKKRSTGELCDSLPWFRGKTLISARDWDRSGPLVNHCGDESIQKQIQLQKSTIPAQTAKKGLSMFELLITPIPANICKPVAAKPPQSCLRNTAHSGNSVKADRGWLCLLLQGPTEGRKPSAGAEKDLLRRAG